MHVHVKDMHNILVVDLSTKIIVWKDLHLLNCLLSSLVHLCLQLSEESIVGLISGSKPLLIQYQHCRIRRFGHSDDDHQLPRVLEIDLGFTSTINKQGKKNTVTEVLNVLIPYWRIHHCFLNFVTDDRWVLDMKCRLGSFLANHGYCSWLLMVDCHLPCENIRDLAISSKTRKL
jgi:hypothetical protein